MEFFSNSDVEIKSLAEYASLFLDQNNNDSDLIQLPPIQRNAVWTAIQVECLWDSILRGFPIGSFLLSTRKIKDNSISLKENKLIESKSNGYFLLDGQQRTRAILLGFKPGTYSRLWIDLDPQLTFDNAEFNDRKYLLRYLTSYQPWGMSDKNPRDKLHESEKSNARKEIFSDKIIHYDYEVNINTKESNEFLNDKLSWPIKAICPIPFDILVNLCGGYSGTFKEPNWQEVKKFVSHKSGEIIEQPKHFDQITNSLKNIIDWKSGAKARKVVFLKQDEINNPTEDSTNVQDAIEVLFRRVNTMGTKLEGEELSYSLLKSSWDGSYEMVSKLLNDEKIGYLFSSTGFVMAAVRVARFKLGKPDDLNPSVSSFRKWIGNNDDNGSFLIEMKNLLEIKKDEVNSKFHSVILRFINIVLYRDGEDIGLPRKLLLLIKPNIIHPVLIWLYNDKENDKEIDEKNRKRILRYLVFSLIGLLEVNKASKKAVEILKKNGIDFPDILIYKEWVKEGYAMQIPDLEKFKIPLQNSIIDGLLRSMSEVMEFENDVYKDFRYRFWNSKLLLIWFQRDYYNLWFQGYNPMSDDAYDTPYDFDHIVPYSHLISTGTITIDADEKGRKKFIDNRQLYINSIGNLRLWPSWANREDQDNCHTKKLRLDVIDDTNNLKEINNLKELNLKSNRDFFLASKINDEDRKLWGKAGGETRDWPKIRRESWQQAVENRVIHLFDKFYDSFNFSIWTEEK